MGTSWVINGLNTKLFFSGDSGYDSHFKTIGDKYGPFDYMLMECRHTINYGVIFI